MIIKVFFSWQSEKADVSDFIRKELNSCCDELSKELMVEISVFDASHKQRGSYNINDAVIKGIEDADIVVADMTPTSIGTGGRCNPNANVIFEFAFACAKHKFENVLSAIDVSQGSLRQMPFDWNHNSIACFNGIGDITFHNLLKDELRKILTAKIKPTLFDATTVFVSERIGQSFPGVRGFREYTDPHEIRMHLTEFFKHPIRFGTVIDPEGDKNPIWMFRGGLSEGINSFEVRDNGIYLIGNDEMKINRIAVYSCHARYYSEYIYIECEGLPPVTNRDYFTPERIEEIRKDLGYCTDEYAVVTQGNLELPITRQQFDDGYAEIGGKIVHIGAQAKLRVRYLTPYNFVVCAKFSSINCQEFDIKSSAIFDGILEGTSSIEDLNELIISLPKPPFRGR